MSQTQSTQEVLTATSEFKSESDRLAVAETDGERIKSEGYIAAQHNKKVTNYRYPNNLGTDEQPHSINFFISQFVPGASQKLVDRANAGLDQTLGVPSARTGNEVTQENADGMFRGIKTAIAIAGGTIGLATGKNIADNLVGKTAGAFAGAALTAKIADNATSLKNSPALRIRDTISLHIPQSPQAKYGATFENESIGTLLGAIGGLGGDVNGLMEAASGGLAGELIARGLADAASLPKELGININAGALARATSKKVRNPFQEQIFKTMNFRTFAFQYKFAPRNDAEFQSVQKIIQLFRFHMHPEKSPTGAFFTFPSVFDIEYRYKDSRNAFVNKIATSVLTDLSIDYGSEGVFTTFRGTAGKPSEITMAMQFREIVLLSKGANGEITDGSENGNRVGY